MGSEPASQGPSRFGAAVLSGVVLGMGVFLSGGRLQAEEDFQRDIRPLLKAHCFKCHGNQNQKGKLDLERFDQASPADLRTWQRVTEQVSAGDMPPKGKPRLSENERASIARWVEELVRKAELAEPSDPGPSIPRRITRREYRNAIHDLLRFDPDVDSYLPEARSQSGYDNQIGQLTFPPELLERYLMLAESVVE